MNPESGRLLIVDDERSIRLSLRTILGNFGYDIVEAARGEEALALVRTAQFDAVLLAASRFAGSCARPRHGCRF